MMKLNEFVAHFAEQFEDTDASVFTPETKFRELEEWSSLLALSIIAMVDEEYDVALKGNEMKAANTIQELFDIVKAKQ
jgi:acyl carrier protein